MPRSLAHCFDDCQYVRVRTEERAGTATGSEDGRACAGEVGLSVADAERASALFKALSDPVRLRLFSRIAARDGEICVCDIQDVGVSQPTVSHHLRTLREAGLIDCERRGTWVYYRAIPAALAPLEVVRPATRTAP
jgi:ArsR family transcriptional regulator